MLFSFHLLFLVVCVSPAPSRAVGHHEVGAEQKVSVTTGPLVGYLVTKKGVVFVTEVCEG